MATRFDTNDFRDSRPNAYWIERSAESSASAGGLIVYILSGAMLICALQARLRILMLSIGRARIEEIMRDHVIAGSARYPYEQLVRQPYVDGNWAGRTQTGLLIAAVQLGAPAEFIREIASNLRDSQVGWRSLKFAILVAFKFAASMLSSPVAGRAGDIAKLAESIELRYSSLPGVSSTTNVVHPPTFRRATSVVTEAPRRTTVNDVLGGGVTFTPAGSEPVPTPMSGQETATRFPATPPAATLPTRTPAAVPAPPAATPPGPIAPTRPPLTVTRSSASGAVAGLALLALAGGAAWAYTSPKKPRRLF